MHGGVIHILVYIIFLIAALWIFGTAAFRLVGFADESETPPGAQLDHLINNNVLSKWFLEHLSHLVDNGAFV